MLSRESELHNNVDVARSASEFDSNFFCINRVSTFKVFIDAVVSMDHTDGSFPQS